MGKGRDGMVDGMLVLRKVVPLVATMGVLALTLAAGSVSAQEKAEGPGRPPDAIVGTRGDDTLVGTDRPDFVDALAGDDTLVGRGSYDFLGMGEGDDAAATR